MLLSCTRHPANQQISCRPISGIFGYRKNAAYGSDNSFLLKHARKCQSGRLRNIQVLLSCTRHPANQQIRCRLISDTFGYRKNTACGSDNSFRPFRQEDVSPADYAISRCFYRVLAIRRTNKSAVGSSPTLSAIGKTLRAVLTTASCPSVKKMSVRQTTQHPGVFSCTRHPANQQIRCRLISDTFGYRKNTACGSDNSFRPFRQEDVSPADYAISRCFYRVLAIRRTNKSAVGSSPTLSAIGKTLRAVLTTASCPSVKKMSVRQTTQHPGVFSCTRHPANQQIRCRPISGTFGYRKNAACGSDNSFRPFRQEDVSPADYATSRCFYHVLAIRRTSKSAVGPSPALSAIGKTLHAVLTTASDPSVKKPANYATSRCFYRVLAIRRISKSAVGPSPALSAIGKTLRAVLTTASDPSFKKMSASRLRNIQAFFSCTSIRRISKSAVGPSPAFSAIGKTLRAVLTTASDPSVKKMSVQQTTQHPGVFFVYSPSGEPANPLSAHLWRFRLSEKRCVRF